MYVGRELAKDISIGITPHGWHSIQTKAAKTGTAVEKKYNGYI